MRLIIVCAAALGGLAIGDVRHFESRPLALAAMLGGLAAVLAWRHPPWRVLALVACAAAVGALRASVVPPEPPSVLGTHVNQTLRLSGRLAAPPKQSASGALSFTLDVTAVGPAGRDPPPIDSTTPRSQERALVIGDPGVLGDLAQGQAAVLEGRLAPADARGPPILLYPRLLAKALPAPAATAAATDPTSVPGSSDAVVGASPPGDASVQAHSSANPASAPPAVVTTSALAGLSDWFAGVRQHADAGMHHYLPEPQASLAAGVLLGGSGHLDAAFRTDLQRSGLAHLVAIDGFKQVVVAAVVGGAAVWLVGARLAVVTSVVAVAGYTLLTGAHPSAVRAALMVGLASLAALTGRVADPLTSLVLAALGMAMLDPRILLDLGLQLSLSATLGIVLLWPGLRRRLRRLPRFVAEPVGLTLAVTLATLPVTLSAFQLLSLVSPLAHIVAVPLLPGVLVSSAVLAMLAPFPPLGGVAAWLAWVPTTALVWVVRLFGGLPAAALSTGRLSGAAALCLAGGLLAWGVSQLPELAGVRTDCHRWGSRHRDLLAPVACIGACLGVVAVLSLLRPDGSLRVEPLALSRGQAVFVRGPTGHSALIVMGHADATVLASQVADHLMLWEHKLDTAVAIDASAEKALALTLSRYPADKLLTPSIAEIAVDVGGGTAVNVASPNGRLVVSVAGPRSAPTTSAARPGSAD